MAMWPVRTDRNDCVEILMRKFYYFRNTIYYFLDWQKNQMRIRNNLLEIFFKLKWISFWRIKILNLLRYGYFDGKRFIKSINYFRENQIQNQTHHQFLWSFNDGKIKQKYFINEKFYQLSIWLMKIWPRNKLMTNQNSKHMPKWSVYHIKSLQTFMIFIGTKRE